MNQETGKAYKPEDVPAAYARGEKLVPISPRVYRFVKAARDARAHALRVQRRERDRIAKKSRKANRRR